MPGIIVPRKTVGEVQRLIEDRRGRGRDRAVAGKIRFTFGDVVLTSKLIDGTFPDYARVIPAGNDKELDGRQEGLRGRRSTASRPSRASAAARSSCRSPAAS